MWYLPSRGFQLGNHPCENHTQNDKSYKVTSCPLGEGHGAMRASNRGEVCSQSGGGRREHEEYRS